MTKPRMIIPTQISHRCLIVNHHSLALLEGAQATRGREKVMGTVLGGGLKNQFPTECLHAAHLVRIWVTMHLNEGLEQPFCAGGKVLI